VDCAACGFSIGLTPSCDVISVEIRGRRYERIRHTTYGGIRDPTCPGCGITAPNIHHAGCEVEVCPACEGLLAGCDCEYMFVRAE
jgi:site-specific DNA recombinase